MAHGYSPSLPFLGEQAPQNIDEDIFRLTKEKRPLNKFPFINNCKFRQLFSSRALL